MAARHGRNGRVFIAATAGAQASPVSKQTKWTFSSGTDDDETTSFGDANKQYVSGLPDASGAFEGFWDNTGGQSYTASRDGAARKLYLYPDFVNDVGTYLAVTAIVDYNLEVDVKGANKVSGNWKAASDVISVGAW